MSHDKDKGEERWEVSHGVYETLEWTTDCVSYKVLYSRSYVPTRVVGLPNPDAIIIQFGDGDLF